MSDFLTSLAARAMGAVASVRPRPASMFEPVADRPARLGSEAAVAGLPEPDRPGAAPTAAGEQRPEATRPTPQPLRAVGSLLDDARTIMRVPVRSEPLVGTAGQPPARAPAAAEAAPDARRPADPSAAASPPVVTRVTRERRHAVDSTVRREQIVREEISVRHVAPEALSARRTAPAPSVPIVPRATAAEPRPAPTAAPEPPVTIEVTIGRVEVRAIHPPPPPRRAARDRSGPALSLDEYLRQRDRG